MYKSTIEAIKKLIDDNEIDEVITATNGTRKVTVKLKSGGSIMYYGEEATTVLTYMNKH